FKSVAATWPHNRLKKSARHLAAASFRFYLLDLTTKRPSATLPQWHLTECKVRQRNHTATWPHMIHKRAARGFHRHLAAGSDGAKIFVRGLNHKLGPELHWGRELGLAENAGVKPENKSKVSTDLLKAKKNLRDMLQSLDRLFDHRQGQDGDHSSSFCYGSVSTRFHLVWSRRRRLIHYSADVSEFHDILKCCRVILRVRSPSKGRPQKAKQSSQLFYQGTDVATMEDEE
ncbi:hypothetical protein BC938DRAFT_471955, partial [Jimgerdemannia flammicorona]